MVGDMPGYATEHQFAQARMSIRPYHQKVRIQIGETRRDLLTHADIWRNRSAYCRLDAVSRQCCSNRGVGAEGLLVAVSFDLEDMHVLYSLKQGKRVENRARGLAPCFPGNHDVAANPRLMADVGNEQNGTATFQREPLRKIKQG
jgi:hypothetical protein